MRRPGGALQGTGIEGVSSSEPRRRRPARAAPWSGFHLILPGSLLLLGALWGSGGCAGPACDGPCFPRDGGAVVDAGAGLDGGGLADGGGVEDGGAVVDGGPGSDGGTEDGGPILDGGALDGGATDGGPTDGGAPDAGAPDGGSTDGGSSDGGAPSDGGPNAPTLSAVAPAEGREGQARLPVYLTGTNLSGATFTVEPPDAGVSIEEQIVRSDRAGLVLALTDKDQPSRQVDLVATTSFGSARISFSVRAMARLDLDASLSEVLSGDREYSSLSLRGTVSGVRGDTAPLRIVVYGDVRIEGVVDVTGANGLPDNAGRSSNPGGLGGPAGQAGGESGTANTAGTLGDGAGGGAPGLAATTGFASGGGGGGFGFPGDPGCYTEGVVACGAVPATLGGGGGNRYGLTHLLSLETGSPVAGGSGGGGGGEVGGGGGGGGGAVLIVALGKIEVLGGLAVDASGGRGGEDRIVEAGEASDDGGGGGGSGGAIWLAASEVTGTGFVRANGGRGGEGGASGAGLQGGNGSPGRIRIDAAASVSTVLESGPTRFYGPAVDLVVTPVLVGQVSVTVSGRAQAGSVVTLRNLTTGGSVTVSPPGGGGTGPVLPFPETFARSITLAPGLNEIRVSQRTTRVDLNGDGVIDARDDVEVDAVTGNAFLWSSNRPVGRLLVVSVPP